MSNAPKNLEELERMTTSERLRVWASMGAKVASYFRGAIPEDATVFGESVIHHGILPESSLTNHHALRERCHAIHTAARWAQFGFNVFDLSLDLAASFLLTDPPEMQESEELKLPFPCFYIRLPPEILPMFAHGKQFWAEGIWCHRFTSTHQLHGPLTPFFRWSTEHGGLSLWKDRFPTNLDDPADQSYYNLVWEGDPPYVTEDEITTSRALRIIKNLVSWLDATGGLDAYPKPQPPHLKKKGSKERRDSIEQGVWPRVWLFGQNVKLRPELRKIAKEFALSQSKDHAIPGWKVRVQHVVRGHFRSQVFGEGKLQRKRIFVEPYWRGPEGAAAWAHIYEAV